ncbi:hypothetical protein [Qaidamihabitans albus]|uniref:hypothetical protein n=1 Tax=Qaidamihabitans albus TaxID=2795733 RepID=UPI0027DB74B1|nr:hypothetical protein [Qaidamihabitans albus]
MGRTDTATHFSGQQRMSKVHQVSTHTSRARSELHEVVATVARRETVARDVVSLTFSLPEGVAWSWQPGDHIDVEVPGGDFRQYSLCGPIDEQSQLTIAVLREQDSRGGRPISTP